MHCVCVMYRDAQGLFPSHVGDYEHRNHTRTHTHRKLKMSVCIQHDDGRKGRREINEEEDTR